MIIMKFKNEHIIWITHLSICDPVISPSAMCLISMRFCIAISVHKICRDKSRFVKTGALKAVVEGVYGQPALSIFLVRFN